MSVDQLILVEAGPLTHRLRVSLSIFKGRPLLNIRYYFENKKGEMQATTKGVAINRNNYLLINDIFKNRHDEMLDFLEGQTKHFEIISFFEKKNIALQSVGAVEKIIPTVKKVPGQELSEIEYLGSHAEVSLNSKNRYVKKNEDDAKKVKVLGDVAVAFDLAQNLIREDESNEVLHALDRLCTEFSRQLQNIPN